MPTPAPGLRQAYYGVVLTRVFISAKAATTPLQSPLPTDLGDSGEVHASALRAGPIPRPFIPTPPCSACAAHPGSQAKPQKPTALRPLGRGSLVGCSRAGSGPSRKGKVTVLVCVCVCAGGLVSQGTRHRGVAGRKAGRGSAVLVPWCPALTRSLRSLSSQLPGRNPGFGGVGWGRPSRGGLQAVAVLDKGPGPGSGRGLAPGSSPPGPWVLGPWAP